MLSIDTKLSKFSIHPKGYLLVYLKNSTLEFDLDEAKAQLDAGLSLTNGVPYFVLVDVRDSPAIPNTKVKKEIAKMEKYKLAEAIVISSLSQRILANFYFKISYNKKSSLPRRVFTDYDRAEDWLLSFL